MNNATHFFNEFLTWLSRISVGFSAAAGVIEASSDVPAEVHAIAAVVLVATNAVNAGVKAAINNNQGS